MPEAVALRARNLSVTLGAAQVVDSIDLDADFGSMLAILGPNGAGKSTLLRACSSLLPYEGSVSVSGTDLRHLSRRELGKRLALVPQRSLLTARLPVHAFVAHGRYAHRDALAQLSARDRRAIDSAMERADVAHLASRLLPELSYGEQRRVLLARALATEARVLLLDEPASSLDVAHVLTLFTTLRRLADDGHCIAVVLHQLDDALRFADRALLLERGRTVASGTVQSVITAEHVRRVYGVELVPGGALGFRTAENRA
jgi:iron complex transport system ATP-binding protein